MTTSGTTSFGMYRDEILRKALRKVGKDDPTPQDISAAADSLNLVLKSLDNVQDRPWKSAWYTKTLTASTERTGSDSNVYTCILGHTSAAANKPITGAEWPIYWKLLGSTGGVWAADATYNSIGDFSIDSSVISVDKVTLRRDEDDYDIRLINAEQYAEIGDKTDFSIPTVAWIDYSQSTPRMHLLDLPDDSDYVIRYYGKTPIEDMTFGNNTGDFPQRWLNPLIYLTADDLVDEYEVSDQRALRISIKVKEYRRMATRGDERPTSGRFTRSCY